MGVKTKITKKDLTPFFKCKKLKETKNGVSHSVYIVDNRYILKIFENITIKQIHNEIKLLKYCTKLKVNRIKKDIFFIKNKPAILYYKCKGKTLKKSKQKHIKQIGKFLQEFHRLSSNLELSLQNNFSKNSLKKMIKKTKNRKFLKIFKNIKIDLKNNGTIHGDLFLDNAIFKKNRLSCIIDFSDTCSGDFLFDLAVVAISWCKTKRNLRTLLKSYEANISIKKFYHYINYALLYYSVLRYLDNREYKGLLKGIKSI